MAPRKLEGVTDSSDPWLIKRALGLQDNNYDRDLWLDFNRVTKEWYDQSGIKGSTKWGDVRAQEREDIKEALKQRCVAKGLFVEWDLDFLARWRAAQLFKNAKKEKPGSLAESSKTGGSGGGSGGASSSGRPYDPVRGG